MTDKLFYQIWKKIGYYIPLAAVLSVMDWSTDLLGTIEFMSAKDDCMQRVFGVMMGVTVFVTPIAFSLGCPQKFRKCATF